MASSSKRAHPEDDRDSEYDAETERSRPTKYKITKGKSKATNSEGGPGKSRSDRDAALAILKLDEEELLTKSRRELVAYLLTLQSFVNGGEAAKPQLSPEQVQERADAAKAHLINNVKRQMRLKPSCRTSGVVWKYTTTVPTFEVFVKLFNLGEHFRGTNVKIATEDFNTLFDHQIQTRVGYERLYLRDGVSIRWQEETCEFTASGRYGTCVGESMMDLYPEEALLMYGDFFLG